MTGRPATRRDRAIGRRRPGAALLFGLVTVVSLSVLPSAAVEAQSSRPEITRIDFHGNRVFKDSELRGAIMNRQSECRKLLPLPLLDPFRWLCWAGVGAFKEESFLQPRELPLDALRLQAYYWLRGYREAAVDTTVVRSDGRMEIDFDIQEGLPVLVESMEILGLEEVNTPGVLDDLPLAVGEPLSAIQLEAVKDTVVSRLREVGYAHAEAYSGFFIPAESRTADVSFDVAPGPRVQFGEVTVEWVQGNQPDPSPELSETSIRRMVPFREGGLYRQSQLVEGQRNLYGLELIRTAQVRPVGDPEALDTIIPVRVVINEGSLHRVRAGAGWSTADCFSTEAQWASRNFFGGARRLTVRARVSNILGRQLNQSACPQVGIGPYARYNWQLATELFQPWFFSPRVSFSSNIFVERQSLPDIFIREAQGVTLALTRAVGRQASVTLSFQPTRTSLTAGEVFFCSSFLLCDEDDRRVFTDARYLSPFGLSFALNRSNRLLNPTAGYSLGLDLEWAPKNGISDFPYSRGVAEAAGYRDLGGGLILAARVRGGVIAPGKVRLADQDDGVDQRLSHPQKRFYTGGANSVRGYGENQLGPRVLSVNVRNLVESDDPPCQPEEVRTATCDLRDARNPGYVPRATGGDALVEANLELRFPLLRQELQGAAFLDVGQVWTRDVTESLKVDLGDLEFTPGLGVRYFSPIGPIRMDVGYRFQGAEELLVLTGSVRRAEAGDDPRDVFVVDGEEWTRLDDLVRLTNRVPFGGGDSFFQKLQFHFSIGQAF